MPIEKLFGMKKSDFFFYVLVHIYAEMKQADRFLADSAVCFVTLRSNILELHINICGKIIEWNS